MAAKFPSVLGCPNRFQVPKVFDDCWGEPAKNIECLGTSEINIHFVMVLQYTNSVTVIRKLSVTEFHSTQRVLVY